MARCVHASCKCVAEFQFLLAIGQASEKREVHRDTMWRKIQGRHVHHRENWEKAPLTAYQQRFVTDIKACFNPDQHRTDAQSSGLTLRA